MGEQWPCYIFIFCEINVSRSSYVHRDCSRYDLEGVRIACAHPHATNPEKI